MFFSRVIFSLIFSRSLDLNLCCIDDFHEIIFRKIPALFYVDSLRYQRFQTLKMPTNIRGIYVENRSEKNSCKTDSKPRPIKPQFQDQADAIAGRLVSSFSGFFPNLDGLVQRSLGIFRFLHPWTLKNFAVAFTTSWNWLFLSFNFGLVPPFLSQF